MDQRALKTQGASSSQEDAKLAFTQIVLNVRIC